MNVIHDIKIPDLKQVAAKGFCKGYLGGTVPYKETAESHGISIKDIERVNDFNKGLIEACLSKVKTSSKSSLSGEKDKTPYADRISVAVCAPSFNHVVTSNLKNMCVTSKTEFKYSEIFEKSLLDCEVASVSHYDHSEPSKIPMSELAEKYIDLNYAIDALTLAGADDDVWKESEIDALERSDVF